MIGLNKLGNAVLVMTGDGVVLTGTSDVIVGSMLGNVISGNGSDGIRVGGGWTGTQIFGNTIALLAGAAQIAGNAGNGINVTDTASGTFIGGCDRQLRSTSFSGNTLNGINVDVNTRSTPDREQHHRAERRPDRRPGQRRRRYSSCSVRVCEISG